MRHDRVRPRRPHLSAARDVDRETVSRIRAEADVGGQIKRINSLDLLGKYVLLFFYPNDFSFVCPTELYAIEENLAEFKKRQVEVVAVSVDSVHAHLAWLTLPRNEGGIEGISFALLSDIHKELSRAFCVLDEKSGVSLRGVFLLDRSGTVQYGAVHSLSLGRDIGELLRVIDAAQFSKKHGLLCPVDWAPGDQALDTTGEQKARYYRDTH